MRVEIGIGPAEPPAADPLVPVQRAMLAAAVMQPELGDGEFNAAAIHGHDTGADKSASIFHGETRCPKRITSRF